MEWASFQVGGTKGGECRLLKMPYHVREVIHVIASAGSFAKAVQGLKPAGALSTQRSLHTFSNGSSLSLWQERAIQKAAESVKKALWGFSA